MSELPGTERIVVDGSGRRANGAGATRGALLGVGLVAVVVLASILLLTDRRPESSTPPTAVNTSIPSAENAAGSSTTTAHGPLQPILTETGGVMVVAVSSGAGVDLVEERSDFRSIRPIPMVSGPVVGFDVSASAMAFLGPAVETDGETLYLGDLTRWAALRTGVTSFAWHREQPAEIAWTGGDGSLCRGGLARTGAFSTRRCLELSEEAVLAGYDSGGFIVVVPRAHQVRRLDLSGALVASLPGQEAHVGPNGEVLIVTSHPDTTGTSFDLSDVSLGSARSLDWAPVDVAGEYRFVAWSPRALEREIAFLVHLGATEWQMQRRDLDGRMLGAVNLSGQYWSIDYDNTGAFLMATGTDSSGGHGVWVVDLGRGVPTFTPHDDWVHDVELLIPTTRRETGWSPAPGRWLYRVHAPAGPPRRRRAS